MSRFGRRLQRAVTKSSSGGTTTFPDATSTGVPTGTALTAVPGTITSGTGWSWDSRGWVTITGSGAVLDSLDIAGHIENHAANVTISKCKIHGNGTDTGVQVLGGTITVLDSEVYSFENAVAWASYTVKRCNIHDLSGDGFKWGSDTLVEDNYVHNFTPANGAHTDGLQMSDGSTNCTLRHNWIQIPWDGPGNGTVFIAPENGPSTNGPVLIENNYLDGGGYTVYILTSKGYTISNITVQNNTIGPNHQYSSVSVSMPNVTWTGNVDSNNNPIS